MRQRIADGAVCSRNVAIYITRDYMVSQTKNSESIMLKHIPEAVGFGNPPNKWHNQGTEALHQVMKEEAKAKGEADDTRPTMSLCKESS